MFKISSVTASPDNGETTASSPKPAPGMHRQFETNGGVMPHPAATEPDDDEQDTGLFDKLRGLIKGKSADTTLRSAIEDYIEETETDTEVSAATGHERTLFSNVVKLRGMTVVDVMIPRADIVAIDIGTSQADLLALLSEKQFSRIPVFRESLDDVVGTIHIKDILSHLAQNKKINIEDLVRDAPIVSPSLPVLDLILMMKQARKHLAFVVDEYGGIDGLVTIGDVIEAIIGEVEDEHTTSDDNDQITLNADGTAVADARVDIEEFEKVCGKFLSDEEREDIDTLGGLIFALAGRIPARGELLTHPSGIVFEILDADPRRVNKVSVRNLPTAQAAN